jgi:hypothetical protein
MAAWKLKHNNQQTFKVHLHLHTYVHKAETKLVRDGELCSKILHFGKLTFENYTQFGKMTFVNYTHSVLCGSNN